MFIILLQNIIKHHNSRYQTYWNPVLQSIIYKFINWGSLGQDPILFGLEPENRDPTILNFQIHPN